MSVSNLYILRIGPDISCSRIGRSIVGIYKSLQAHKCGNWDSGRAISFLGKCVSIFRYWLFALQATPSFHSFTVMHCYLRVHCFGPALHIHKVQVFSQIHISIRPQVISGNTKKIENKDKEKKELRPGN